MLDVNLKVLKELLECVEAGNEQATGLLVNVLTKAAKQASQQELVIMGNCLYGLGLTESLRK